MKNLLKKWKKCCRAVCSLAAAATFAFAAPADAHEAQQSFPEGASVGGVDLSGQTFEEGQSLLNETVRSVAEIGRAHV